MMRSDLHTTNLCKSTYLRCSNLHELQKNTFADFLACAHHLVTSHYTSRALLAVWGRSAGGLTVAAALNLDPGFAGAAVLDVPFLDVLGTMRDPGLPLTIRERREWGDPLNDKVRPDMISGVFANEAFVKCDIQVTSGVCAKQPSFHT